MDDPDQKAIEVVARALCQADGVNPDADALPLSYHLYQTPLLQVVPIVALRPAWTLYAQLADRAIQIVEALPA